MGITNKNENNNKKEQTLEYGDKKEIKHKETKTEKTHQITVFKNRRTSKKKK
jgi:hypothetical protein